MNIHFEILNITFQCVIKLTLSEFYINVQIGGTFSVNKSNKLYSYRNLSNNSMQFEELNVSNENNKN